MNIISKQTLISCALLSLTACASLPDAETENTASTEVSAPPVAVVTVPALAQTAQLAPAAKKKSSRKARRTAAKKAATNKQAKAKKSRVQSVVRKQLSVEKFAASLDANDDKQDLWTRIRDGYALKAPENNGQIRRAIERFVRAPSYFRDISNRASPFLYHIVEEIEQRGMPLEIALLPAIESAFEPGALSPKRAAGIWQFTPGTARNFGLQLDSWYDGRRDVVASTSAALDYLQKLHQEFNGDWFTALAAYNFGEGNIRKAIARNRSAGRPTDFWSLDLPTETRNYIPSLLAISTIIAKPHQYGISLRSIADSPQIEHIEIGSQIDLTVAARLAGLSPLDLKRLNPGYRRSITAPEGPFGIALPIDKADDFKRRLADMSAEQLVSNSVKAQVVAEVAADKDEDIKALSEDDNVASNADAKNLLNVNTAKAVQQYRVSRGDTLASIAQRHGTTVEYLRSLNQALNKRSLKIGEVLQVPSKLTPASNEVMKTSHPLKLASRSSN
jgi:membrane-bound lytic murein transglycosylase D